MCQPHMFVHVFLSSPGRRDMPDIWWDPGRTTKAETFPKASVSEARQKNFIDQRVLAETGAPTRTKRGQGPRTVERFQTQHTRKSP